MKLAIVSDLHLDMNSGFAESDLLPILVEELKKCEADTILIAGDICSDALSSIKAIDEIRSTVRSNLLFIPGNHDIWVKDGGSSWDSYQRLANHPACLVNRPYSLDDSTVIIGDMGWFDYSFLADDVSFSKMEETREDWGDKKYTEWGRMDDPALTEYMLAKLDEQLRKHTGQRIILAVHFIPYRAFLPKKSPYMDWDVCNAFMGSEAIGQLLDAHESIDYVIFGHTHDRHGIRKYKSKTIICSPLGYISEKSPELFRKELAESIVIIDL